MELETFSATENPERLEQIWELLPSRKSASFFTSKRWIQTWLESLPSNINIQAHVIYTNTKMTGLLFTGKNPSFLHRHTIALNETGNKSFDLPLWVEYNNIIGSPKADSALYELLSSIPEDWEQVDISGIQSTTPLCQFAVNTLDKDQHYNTRIKHVIPSHYVDLKNIHTADEYLSKLSKNTRSQIRRSYRGYETQGPITTQRAETLEEALSFFKGLWEMHNISFEQRKKKSRFISDYSYAFHQSLITECFQHNEIFITKTLCGNEIIGYVYNFIYNNRVYYFQSGLSHPNNPKLKPGLTCHHQAILIAIRDGLSYYDFLAGTERYKASLSTHHNTLLWLRIRKEKWHLKAKSKLLSPLRRFKTSLNHQY